MYNKNYYAILNISFPSTVTEIKNAYRQLAKAEHPDKGGNAEKMKLVNEAYHILINVKSKAEYDMWFNNQSLYNTIPIKNDRNSDCAYPERAAKSSNPKWHRTKQEKAASTEFYLNNLSDIEYYEANIHNDFIAFDKSKDISERISACEETINAFYEFRTYCYQTYGGTVYFQDHWEYCHNSKNDCFSYIDNLNSVLKKLNKENVSKSI